MLDHSGFKAQTTDEKSTLTDTERKGTGIFRVVDLLKQGIEECDFRFAEKKNIAYRAFVCVHKHKLIQSYRLSVGVNVVHANTLVNIICTN